jgi:hypothetical protein
MKSAITIPSDKALELRKAYREKNGVRVFSQCWGCIKFSGNNTEKMCVHKPPNNDGCKIVNRLFEESK